MRLSLTAVTYCDFLPVRQSSHDPHYESLGFITRDALDTDPQVPDCMLCQPSFDSRDSFWKTGMAFGIIAGYGGFVVLLWLLIVLANVSNNVSNKHMRMLLALVYVLLAVASLLMFVLGWVSDLCRQEMDCSLGTVWGCALHFSMSHIPWCSSGYLDPD